MNNQYSLLQSKPIADFGALRSVGGQSDSGFRSAPECGGSQIKATADFGALRSVGTRLRLGTLLLRTKGCLTLCSQQPGALGNLFLKEWSLPKSGLFWLGSVTHGPRVWTDVTFRMLRDYQLPGMANPPKKMEIQDS